MNASHNIDDKIIYTDGNDIIRIIDNFFSEDVLKKIVDYFKSNKWVCQCIKDPNIIISKSGDRPYWRTELENEYLFNFELKNIIEKYLNKYFKLDRIYAVGQTYGQNSVFHIDNDDDNTLTFCFYINNFTIDTHDGLFYVKIPKKKFIISIEPTMNRAVIFPSNYKHKGSGYNRFNSSFRICIAWKFKIIENDM